MSEMDVPGVTAGGCPSGVGGVGETGGLGGNRESQNEPFSAGAGAGGGGGL